MRRRTEQGCGRRQTGRIAGDQHLAAVTADVLAAPVGDLAAGAEQDGARRLDVPALQPGLDGFAGALNVDVRIFDPNALHLFRAP